MHYELNIGLDVSGSDNSTAARQSRISKALGLLCFANIATVAWEVVGELDDSFEHAEPCLYVAVIGRNIGVAVGHISEKLGQDCIAMVDEDGVGELVGPRASGWGDFNPAFFRRPSFATA